MPIPYNKSLLLTIGFPVHPVYGRYRKGQAYVGGRYTVIPVYCYKGEVHTDIKVRNEMVEKFGMKWSKSAE